MEGSAIFSRYHPHEPVALHAAPFAPLYIKIGKYDERRASLRASLGPVFCGNKLRGQCAASIAQAVVTNLSPDTL